MVTSRTPVIARAARLLRAAGAHAPNGASTTQLAADTGLARPTAHRLLVTLADEGLMDRDSTSGRWNLGPELFLLGAGAGAGRRYDITDDARDLIDRVARETGESAFLSARRGDETVCTHSQEGSFPLRSHVLHEGVRFPLGVASAGLAILSHLPDGDVEAYLGRSNLSADWGDTHSESAIRRRIAATREKGYAVNPALLVEGSWGLGAAVFDHSGRPAWALSVTGVETRFGDVRRREMGALLLNTAHELSQRLRGHHTAR
ncbi:IclR family transcriptional regulator [Gordonia terrae]|uniref:IclR family transcriptional regulator n=2 Tax=Gordonia terrae TaxID=2055 RepID=A0AAD0P007_9ACTN|nr:IclR family transcriptional regulator [Gordonia terrae]ANY25881.1 IclR family transcriptional regulator [Gordonia terrae]AWO86617.1 IclR family transcriptional regulator [Gordonia terrae]VTR06829.1 IclR family transcriptional regulator [Clostridioides difficile]VTS36533.1 Acetate operon repressor [Gordonia terrae]